MNLSQKKSNKKYPGPKTIHSNDQVNDLRIGYWTFIIWVIIRFRGSLQSALTKSSRKERTLIKQIID